MGKYNINKKRNRQIAELRGDMWMALPKPYDTDIACVMELWEEMKGDGCALTLHTFFEDHRILAEIITDDGNTLNHEGDTEAEAIAGAWLKWKEIRE